MKNNRWRIKTLLILTLLVAVVLFVLRPNSPQLEFALIKPSTYTHESGSIDPCYDLPVHNRGFIPIWLAADSASKPSFIYFAGETADDVREVTSVSILEETNKHWIRLEPGASTILHIPAHTLNDFARVGVLVSDWRGHTAGMWTAPFSSPPLH